MIIDLNKHLISYNKSDKKFFTEASSLSRGNFLHRLFEDACDEGVTLHNPTTGVNADFYVANTIYNRDQELVEWVLHPTPEAIRKSPRLDGVILIIAND